MISFGSLVFLSLLLAASIAFRAGTCLSVTPLSFLDLVVLAAVLTCEISWVAPRDAVPTGYS